MDHQLLTSNNTLQNIPFQSIHAKPSFYYYYYQGRRPIRYRTEWSKPPVLLPVTNQFEVAASQKLTKHWCQKRIPCDDVRLVQSPNSIARTQWLARSMHDNLNLVLRRNQKPYSIAQHEWGRDGAQPHDEMHAILWGPIWWEGKWKLIWPFSAFGVSWKKKAGEEEIKVIVYGITAIDQVVFY